MSLETAPLLPPAAAFALGIALAVWLGAGALPLLILAGLCLLAAGAALRFGRDHVAVGAVLAGAVSLGALSAASPAVPADHIARRALPPSVVLEGRLVEEPVRWTPDRTRLLLDVEAIQDGSERQPASGRVLLTVYGEAPALAEGQRLSAEARLHSPVGFRNPGGFDYPAHLRRDGILLVGSARGDALTALTPEVPPWPVAVRRWAVASLRARLPESSAALEAGLLLGERTALPRETDEAFRRAGVYHVLAVSGFNVALLASSVFFSLSLLGMPRRGTAIVAGLVLVGFAFVVGAQPSVLRATVMGLLLLASVLIERESQVMNALAVAALILLAWRPGDLWEPGFQLSYAATVGIVYLAEPLSGWLKERGWPHWLAVAAAVSAGAQAAVTPIMLAHFNQLSLVGIAANLLVVPLAGAATTLGMLALLVELASGAAAALLFNALWTLLLALRASVRLAAMVPAAMVHLPAPGWLAVSAWYGALGLIPYGGRPWARRAALALCLLVTASSAWPWLRLGDRSLRVSFLDVGQGDAVLVELPEGPRLLVDGGPGGAQRFDVGERVLAPFLWNRGAARLDVVALTHEDSDHAGGLAAVLRRFTVGEFWETGRSGPGSTELERALGSARPARRVLGAGQRIWLGGAVITVLNPAPDGGPASANDDSLVLRLDWRGVSLLLTGDLGPLGEARLVERGGPLRILTLKVAHHGSRFSSSAAFLDAARPDLAVISVGARNPFRHPSPETLARLGSAGARVYRTDRDGAVILETDGATLWVTRWAQRVTDRFDLDPERPPRAREPDSLTPEPAPL
jgi:competence protein ComEC